MKTKGILTFVFCLCLSFVFGQNSLPGSGNVGIGTASPSVLLDVTQALNANGQVMTKLSNTGSANANALFLNGGTANANFAMGSNGTVKGILGYDGSRDFFGLLNFAYSPNDFSLRLNADGSLTYHDVKLAGSPIKFKVDNTGKLQSTEIEVKTTIADYVFAEGYDLLSLEETEAFIKENKHLPNVQSQQNVDDNDGFIKIGALSVSVLEKVEELTLHLIELNKKVKQLEAENKKLAVQLNK